jgi:hypothetical protein
MNPVLGDWIRRQASALYEGEPCTSFRLYHMAVGDRATPLDRFLLSEGEDPAGVIGRVQALSQQHAEAFAGMPQRYMLTACYGASHSSHANYVWRLQGAAPATLAGHGSEPSTSEGQMAQMMRHTEFLVRSLSEMSAQRIREQTAQSAGLQTQLQWMQTQLLEQHKLASQLRLEAEDTKDRQQAREIEALRAVQDLEKPEESNNSLQQVMDLIPMVMPGVQTFLHAKFGVPMPAELHPVMQRLSSVFEHARSTLTEDDVSQIIMSLPAAKQASMMQLFKALQEAHDFAKQARPDKAESEPPPSSAPRAA